VIHIPKMEAAGNGGLKLELPGILPHLEVPEK
jgi:hypothetical protein